MPVLQNPPSFLRREDFPLRICRKRRRAALPLPLALRCPFHFLLQRSARHSRGSLRLGRGLLARSPLQLFSFRRIRYRFCIHQSLFSPAYFSTSFFSPYPGK